MSKIKRLEKWLRSRVQLAQASMRAIPTENESWRQQEMIATTLTEVLDQIELLRKESERADREKAGKRQKGRVTYGGTNDLREQLAAIEHERWADWQRWMHSCGRRNGDGSLTIPPQLVERWQRQIDTPYAALSDEEKESDRVQVDRFWPLVAPTIAAMEAVVTAAVAWVAAEREMQHVVETSASHGKWMAAAQTKHDARQALHDALDALAGGERGVRDEIRRQKGE